jgi:hypothetical protein
VSGGLRKRVRSYLHVPSATVADGRPSFKARGILAYLLDKPAGWDVRSVAIAADSPDGKAAVQAGQRELARAGYYLIERRRLADGRLVTGTTVSEEPVTSWASEYAEYQGPSGARRAAARRRFQGPAQGREPDRRRLHRQPRPRAGRL